MPIGLIQQRWPLVPSGIDPGITLSLPLREALATHAGVPLMYQPIIEEGSYNDFKACVLRVCSVRACEVALEDMEQECREKGGIMRGQYRHWKYAPNHRCVTAIEIQMEIQRGSQLSHDMEEFLSYLARKYDFTYNKLTVNYQRSNQEGIFDGYRRDSGLTVEMEIVWPYWT